MNKYTLKINGSKLRSLLESTTGKSLTDISLANGFSKNFLNEACRVNKATNSVQAVAKLYGIAPEAYKIKEPVVKADSEISQISIDDIESIKRSELLELIKDAVREVIREELKALIKEALTEVLFENDVVIRNPKKKTIKIFGSEEV